MIEATKTPKRRGRPKKTESVEASVTKAPRKRRAAKPVASHGVTVADVKKVTKFLEKNAMTSTELRGVLDLMDTVHGT